MNSPESKLRHSSVVILPDNLIEEILSFLNVKSLMQFKCVCKSWKTLITSDPIFIKLHLKRSARNGHLALIYDEFNIIRLPLTSLIHHNTSITTPLPANPYFHEPCFRDSFFHQPDAPHYPYWSYLKVVGSCNGLLCLYGYVTNYSDYEEIFLYLWNPATKTLSSKIVFIHDEIKTPSLDGRWKFWFGYDNSTKNYKIVAFNLEINEPHSNQGINNPGVYVSGTVNWLAIPN
ncbi:F-box/kelch-repeat protein, partial [Trifolium medium]|nr:F-box/kelch-repeat protein [Trifolium medium]